MQHINLSNYKGSITDWTELNYINGGLADNLADIANIKVNDSCYNYFAKSANILNITDVAETTTNGITYKVENGAITLNGTSNANTNIWLTIQEITCNGTYYFKVQAIDTSDLTSTSQSPQYDFRWTMNVTVTINNGGPNTTTTIDYGKTYTTFLHVQLNVKVENHKIQDIEVLECEGIDGETAKPILQTMIQENKVVVPAIKHAELGSLVYISCVSCALNEESLSENSDE